MIHTLGWMDERCFRPLLCTVKAELGREQPGLMRWIWDETLPQSSIDRSTPYFRKSFPVVPQTSNYSIHDHLTKIGYTGDPLSPIYSHIPLKPQIHEGVLHLPYLPAYWNYTPKYSTKILSPFVSFIITALSSSVNLNIPTPTNCSGVLFNV